VAHTHTTSNGNVDVTMGATGDYRLDGTTATPVTWHPQLDMLAGHENVNAAQTTGYDSAQISIREYQTSNAPVTVAVISQSSKVRLSFIIVATVSAIDS
jgi:hypothetical protein